MRHVHDAPIQWLGQQAKAHSAGALWLSKVRERQEWETMGNVLMTWLYQCERSRKPCQPKRHVVEVSPQSYRTLLCFPINTFKKFSGKGLESIIHWSPFQYERCTGPYSTAVAIQHRIYAFPTIKPLILSEGMYSKNIQHFSKMYQVSWRFLILISL